MPKDILRMYGPDSPANQKPRATSGGVTAARDVMNYKPPQGPIGISRTGVGLGGVNYGPCGVQGNKSTKAIDGGSPGLHGSRYADGLDNDDDIKRG